MGLVNAMANGIKPVQYAARVNKSVATVQSQRQAVFQKVGVKNQLELMSVLRDLTTAFEDPSEGKLSQPAISGRFLAGME